MLLNETMAGSEVQSDKNEKKSAIASHPHAHKNIPKKLEVLAQEIYSALQEEIKRCSSAIFSSGSFDDNEINNQLENNGSNDDSSEGLFLRSKSKRIRELYKTRDGSDYDSQHSTTNPLSHSLIKLDVILAWKSLLDALVEHHVFLDYFQSLEDAFREIMEKPAPYASPDSDNNSSTSNHSNNSNTMTEGQARASTIWFRHQYNLANLLTHTVNNHFRDNCTECRFVTLLEIALSYQSNVTSNEGDSKVVYQWKPSNDVQRFWVRLMQPIDPDMPPFDFRRKSYGVLVSLSWVPSSKGLLEACSIADNRPPSSPDTPARARQILSKIPRRPLPRSDSVYQVLDRLKDETNVSVVIAASKYNKVSSLGIGKTTVAALVASHPLILRSFKVMWLTMDYKRQSTITSAATLSGSRGGGKDPPAIDNGNTNVKQGKLDFVQYIRYLDNLCNQLGCTQVKGGTNAKIHKESPAASSGVVTHKRPSWPEAHSLQRLEEPAIRHKREENLMRRAKQMMADLLDKTGRNILLILDDVSDKDELDWFHFIEKQSLLATSQTSINGADFVVELDPWGEEESIGLFLLETDFPESHIMASAIELRQIVSRCLYHPIIVRTAARWFMLKKVTAGLIDALEEAEEQFTPALGSLSAPPFVSDQATVRLPTDQMMTSTLPRSLVNVLNQMLSPTVRRLKQPSMLFRLCLASMAAVFADAQPVPLTAVLLLWEQLFSMEPDAMEECGGNLTTVELKKRVWFIAEGLTHMGLLSFTEDDTGDALVAIHHDLYVRYALGLVSDFGENPEDTIVQWHKAFVAAYLTRKFEGNNPDSCHEYALQKLPTHMLHCKLYVKVVALLSNGRLYKERVAAFGKDRSTDLHVSDCIQLMQCIRRDPKIPREQRDEITHFKKVAALLTENFDMSQQESAVSLAKDLYAIGFGLAENGKYREALDLYAQAQDLVPKSSSFAATVLYGLGSVSLLLNDHGKAIKCLMASIACMQILGEDGEDGRPRNTLYQEVSRLYGEALMAQCSYKMALTQFEETLEQMQDDSFESEIEYGILMQRKGRLHQVMGDLEMAATELNKCIAWKEKLGERSRNLAAAHSALADIYADSKPSDARKHIDLALKAIKEVDEKWPKLVYDDDDDDDGDDNDIEGKLLSAKWRSLRPDLPEDLSSYELIHKKLTESPVLLMDKSGYDLRCIARAFMAADEHEKAVSVLEDALKIMSERTESLERALCLLDLGNSFMDQGESYHNEQKATTMFDLALKLFELALNIQRPKLGDCQQVLETLDAIGNLHVHLDQHENAVSVYSEALILARKLRSGSEKIAGILYFLGECQEALGQLDLAELRYKDCLEGLKLERASDDLDLARPLQRLGAISLVTGRYDDAKEIYDELLKIRAANFEPHDVLIAETLDVLGFVEMRNTRRNFESACSYLTRALEIRMQHENFRAIGDTLFQIGYSYRMRGDFTNALIQLEKSLNTLEDSVLDERDTLVANVNLAIGNTHFNLGKVKEAELFCQRGKAMTAAESLNQVSHQFESLEIAKVASLVFRWKATMIRTSLLGPDHRKTGNAARSLGMVHYMLNKTNEAQFLLQEYCRIYEGQADFRNNVEYMVVLIMLSDIQVANGRHKLAKKILATAKELSNKEESDSPHLSKLKEMIDLRRSIPTPTLIARFQERREEEVILEHNEPEVRTFQSIILLDD